MRILSRGLALLGLLALALFCGFGFLATDEPPGWPALRAGYAIVGLLCVAAIVWTIGSDLARRPS